jgi:hypothetical protein
MYEAAGKCIFDGAVNFQAIGEEVEAKKNSKYFKKGDPKFEAGTLTAAEFRRIMQEDVVAPLLMRLDEAALCGMTHIDVQCDGAGGHGLAKGPARD